MAVAIYVVCMEKEKTQKCNLTVLATLKGRGAGHNDHPVQSATRLRFLMEVNALDTMCIQRSQG
jgi:hypothetical protein